MKHEGMNDSLNRPSYVGSYFRQLHRDFHGPSAHFHSANIPTFQERNDPQNILARMSRDTSREAKRFRVLSYAPSAYSTWVTPTRAQERAEGLLMENYGEIVANGNVRPVPAIAAPVSRHPNVNPNPERNYDRGPQDEISPLFRDMGQPMEGLYGRMGVHEEEHGIRPGAGAGERLGIEFLSARARERERERGRARRREFERRREMEREWQAGGGRLARRFIGHLERTRRDVHEILDHQWWVGERRTQMNGHIHGEFGVRGGNAAGIEEEDIVEVEEIEFADGGVEEERGELQEEEEEIQLAHQLNATQPQQ